MSKSQQFLDTLKLIDDLRGQLKAAGVASRDLEQQALAEICPFAGMERKDIFIPVGKTQAIIRPTLSVEKPHVEGGAARWVARGQLVRFRMGMMEDIKESEIDQPAYEALPEDIRALTMADMVENTKKQELTGAGKPLKLTPRQLSMFAMLGSNICKTKFDINGVEGGQHLPAGIWDSMTATRQIWMTMIKRGVLVLVSGNPQLSSDSWRVNPGPRFKEAVHLVLDKDFTPKGSHMYNQMMATFRPEKSNKPSGRKP